MEVWKPLPSFPNYEASSEGRIRNSRGEIVRLRKYMDYYFIWSGGWNRSVHRLVAEAFLGPSSLDVHHKDGNGLNNKPSNLEYSTRCAHAPRGKEAGRPRAKLSEHSAWVIKWHLKNTPIISRKDLAEAFGVSRKTIDYIARGYRWTWIEV